MAFSLTCIPSMSSPSAKRFVCFLVLRYGSITSDDPSWIHSTYPQRQRSSSTNLAYGEVDVTIWRDDIHTKFWVRVNLGLTSSLEKKTENTSHLWVSGGPGEEGGAEFSGRSCQVAGCVRKYGVAILPGEN